MKDGGVKRKHRAAIIELIAANERVEKAVLFGSRAMGTHTVTSDVDIALFGHGLTRTDQARLAEAIDEIPMAQSVDLVLYDSIDNPALLEHIRIHGAEWYSREGREAGSRTKPHRHNERRKAVDRLYLQPHHRRKLQALLRDHFPNVEVWAYGSQVNGRSHDGSDLNLVLRGPGLKNIPNEDLAAFMDALSASNIPFRVEAHDWAGLPERFRQEIERKHVVFVGSGVQVDDDAWEIVPLGNLVDIFDGPHATPKKTPKGPVFLGISNLAFGRLDLKQTEHLSYEDYVRWTRRVTPRPNDIVFSYETRLGEAALIPKGLQACLGRRMGLLRPKGGSVDARFLLYAFLGEKFQDILQSRTVHGSTVDRILLTEMADFPIDVPRAIEEQRSIAHILGTLDDKIELNRRMNETLEATARALFKSWFVDFDPVRAKMEGRDPGLPAILADRFPDHLVDSELGQVPEGVGSSNARGSLRRCEGFELQR